MTRTAMIKVAVSTDERSAIRKHAKQCGLSVAALVRTTVLAAVPSHSNEPTARGAPDDTDAFQTEG